LTAENADALLSGYDVILDGTDNFPTRYLINETCARLGKPDVWASVFRFEGQVAVFDARKGPCYRCLFPEIPPSEEIPACAEAGVLGVLPGVLGTTQALEAIKLLLGIGQPLIGRLLFFDALGLSWSELSFEKDPACPTCGTSADLADRPIPAARSLELPEESVTALDPDELQQRLEEDATVVVIDCREPFEWEICQIPGSRLVPLRTLTEGLSDLHKETPLVIVCHHGPRALHAASYLLQAGFSDVSYLEGGLHAWALHVDPRMPRY
jgi:adenylyltransferase/sulfurtransferase